MLKVSVAEDLVENTVILDDDDISGIRALHRGEGVQVQRGTKLYHGTVTNAAIPVVTVDWTLSLEDDEDEDSEDFDVEDAELEEFEDFVDEDIDPDEDDF